MQILIDLLQFAGLIYLGKSMPEISRMLIEITRLSSQSKNPDKEKR